MSAEKHFWALDTALGVGVSLEYKGVTWELSPLNFGDMAAVMAHARSLGVKAYLEAANDLGLEAATKQWDMNAILYGAAPQTCLTDPAYWIFKVRRSLLKKHPQITEEQVEAFFTDPDLVGKLCEIVSALSAGPQTPGQKGAPTDENPTPTESPPPTPNA